MDKDFRQFQLRKELAQLEKQKFLSDQEEERIKEIKEELQDLRQTKTFEQIPDIDYSETEDLKIDEKELDNIIASIDVNNADNHTLKTLEKAVTMKERRIKLLKKIKQLEQDEFTQEAELEELKKEKNFMQGKKNKDGTIPFRENVYQKRLAEAKTGRQRLNLKLIKAQTKMHNAMIIAPKKIAAVSNAIGEISRGIGDMGSQFGNYSGYEEPKPKKKSKKKSQDSEQDTSYDFGFNPKDVFNLKGDW